MNITKEAWGEILRVLKKYKVPYTSRYVSRDAGKKGKHSDTVIEDRHIQINIVIPDYFREST